MSTDGDLKRALALHQAGNLADAAQIYRDIIKADPRNADAWNLLSVIFVDTGEAEAAIMTSSQAIALQPDFFAPYVSLGNALQLAGRVDDAVKAFTKATDLAPQSPEAHNNLASALNAKGLYDEALVSCKVALAYRPDFLEAFNNKGNAEAGLGMLKEAEASYRRVLKAKPDHSDALFNLGNALSQMDRADEAIGCYRMAVRLDPERPEKHFNLARAFQESGRMPDAEAAYREAVKLRPGYVDALNNLGSVVQALGRLDEAEALFRRAMAEEPGSGDVHWNLALVQIQKGNYADGWREYEWRWRNPAFTSPVRSFEQPLWDGEDIAGKTILLHAEQGFGDTIQFSRYAPLVAARGAKVILECRPPLTSLLETLDGVERVVAKGETLGDFDLHVPLMSLPRIFATTLGTVPAGVPYLKAPSGRTAGERVAATKGLKAGFVWSGSRTRRDNMMRSVRPADFATLFDVPGVTFFSLQVDAPNDGLDRFPQAIDLAPAIEDFADTAAAVEALDLVITVDTAVAHLAGALNKPVWVLLAFAPGYLWMLEREDSPWYPTARLFRQPAWGDWNSVFIEAKAALRDVLRERA